MSSGTTTRTVYRVIRTDTGETYADSLTRAGAARYQGREGFRIESYAREVTATTRRKIARFKAGI